MKQQTVSILFAISVLPALANARPIEIHRNAIIKINMDDTISLVNNRAGDRISATVTDDRDIPTGSKFVGRIEDIYPSDRGRPGSVTMRFDRLLLPNGDTAPVNAVPVRWDMVRRERDGQLHLVEQKTRKENYVFGGFLSGALLGGILRKPFEGAMIGTLAGIFAGETTDSDNKRQFVVHKGDTFGALLKDDFVYGGAPRRNLPEWGGPNSDVRRSDDLRIAFDNRVVDYAPDQRPYRKGDAVMVPLDATARQLKLDTDQAQSGQVVYISNDANSARVEVDSPEYRLNGQSQSLSAPAERRNGVVYVPVEVFAKMQVGRVTINGTDLRN